MILLVARLAAIGLLHARDGGEPLGLAPEDLFARTYVRELSLSPDGRIALVFEAAGREGAPSELVALELGDGARVKRGAHGLPDDAWGPVAWDPASREAAFLRGSPPRTEIWRWRPGGAPERALPAGVAGGVFAVFWRGRGAGAELIALHNAVAGRREAVLSKVDVMREELGEELLRFGDFTIREAALSPDGRRLALVATEAPTYAPEGEPLDLYVVELASGDVRRLTRGDGIAARPSFSPDSARLACTLQGSRTLLSTAKRDVVVFDLDSGAARNATEALDASIGDGVYGAGESLWFLDERTILVATQHGLADHVLGIELPDPPAAPRCRFLAVGAGSWQKLRVSAAARRLLAVESGPAQPERIVAAQWPDPRPVVVESPNQDLEARPLASGSVVRFDGADGWPMEGVLLTPRGAPPFPTVVLLHGGSSGRSTLRFNDGFSHSFAALRYAVFAPNLRGSAGYGVAFNGANQGDFGGKEIEDLEAGVDELVRLGLADPDRIFLVGHSYGGYLVQMALVRSGRYRAACAASAVSDWERFARTSDLAALAWIGLGGGPEQRRELYAQRSPLAQVARMSTPLLLVHGERDQRVPVDQSERLHAALQRHGNVSELLRLPAVGHLLRGPDVALRWIRATDEFFRRHDRAAAFDAAPPQARDGR